MHMRIISPGQVQTRVKRLASVLRVALPAERKSCIHELDIGAFAQSIIDHRLVFVDGDGTRRVDDVSAGLGLRTDTVDGTQDELLLKVREQGEIAFRLRAERNTVSDRSKKANHVPNAHTLLIFTLESLLITPVPLQGASSSTLSNPPITFGNSLPS